MAKHLPDTFRKLEDPQRLNIILKSILLILIANEELLFIKVELI